MTQKERALASKIRNCLESQVKSQQQFTREENYTIQRWLTLGILSEKAFLNVTALNDDYMAYSQMPTIYPFTKQGEEETTKGWYMRFRQGKAITIIRDILTALAFLASLSLAVVRLLPGSSPVP